MANEAPINFQRTFTAGADLSANQYKFVKLDSSGNIVACSATTDIPIGVQQNNPSASGRAVVVMLQGVTKMVASAAISIGAAVGTSSGAKAVSLTFPTSGTYAAPTVYVGGRALTAASADGDVFTAIVDCARPSRLA